MLATDRTHFTAQPLDSHPHEPSQRYLRTDAAMMSLEASTTRGSVLRVAQFLHHLPLYRPNVGSRVALDGHTEVVFPAHGSVCVKRRSVFRRSQT